MALKMSEESKISLNNFSVNSIHRNPEKMHTFVIILN
jgi:hypothetical protein